MNKYRLKFLYVNGAEYPHYSIQVKGNDLYFDNAKCIIERLIGSDKLTEKISKVGE